MLGKEDICIAGAVNIFHGRICLHWGEWMEKLFTVMLALCCVLKCVYFLNIIFADALPYESNN